jgi:hypothetical protein
MPTFPFSSALTANQLGFNPITTWQFERIPEAWARGAAVQILSRATTTGVRLTIFSGSETIQQRSPVQGSGTAGLTPSVLNTTPVEFVASPGDRLIFQFDEVAAGTPTVDGLIQVEPL